MTVPKLLRAAAGAAVDAALCLSRRPAAAPEPESVRRLLVLGYAAIGDLIFLLPVLRGLRLRFPKARIVFVSSAYPTTEELIPASGLADEVWTIEWERALPAEAGAFNARIRDYGFDAAVLSLSSPAHFFRSGLRAIPIRAGHLRDMAQWGGPWARAKRALITGELARRALLNRPVEIGAAPEPVVGRNLRLLDALGVPQPADRRPVLPITAAHRAAATAALGPAAASPRLVTVHLGPTDNQYFKMWAPERFGRLCRLLAERWRAEIVLVGGPDERAAEIAALAAAGGAMRSLAGRCALMETFAVIERSRLMIACDTGLAKAAIALGVPTATLWGPTDPIELGAFADPEKHLDIRTGIACSPCVALGMAKQGAGVLNYLNCGHHDCLGKLEVDAVVARLAEKYDPIFITLSANG